MNEQEDFFSSNHKRLLNIATWAKYVAWGILAIYLLLVTIQIIQVIRMQDNENVIGQTSQSFLTILSSDPLHAFRLIITIAATLLRGVVYYLVLKGVSLGLNMIVETDINYRDQKRIHNE